MRLDHIAYRVAQGKRDQVAKFFCEAMGYRIQGEPFEIKFDDEGKQIALCVALEPPEKTLPSMNTIIQEPEYYYYLNTQLREKICEYHLAPEIFISEGSSGSIVEDWVQSRGGVGGIHHLAYEVYDVEATMKEWQEKGWGEFTSDKPMSCPGITQVFSKPNPTGIIFEFIKRTGEVGFCKDNVKNLMMSTKRD
jgi:4-hydroxyphenylpyruvate dioxygenase-like putative hemolysin